MKSTAIGNTTHQTLQRSIGGGYAYEFLLGAEIALVALLPDFQADWSCDEEEIPIFSRLRTEFGRVVELAPDQPVTRTKKPVGEDINLECSNGSKLHIQVKSGSISPKELKGIILRFLDVFELHHRQSQFLLIVEEGLPHGIEREPTLAQAETIASASPLVESLAHLARTRLKSDEAALDFLGRVHLSRGPLVERVLSSLQNLMARFAKKNRCVTLDRYRVSRMVSSYYGRYSLWATRRDTPLTSTRVLGFLERPPTFEELAQKGCPGFVVKKIGLLTKLEQILGWEIVELGSDRIELLLMAALVQPTVEKPSPQQTIVDLIQAAQSSTHWSPGSLNPLGLDVRLVQLLRLVRLATILGGELVSPLLESQIVEGDGVAQVLCYLSLGSRIVRGDSGLTIETVSVGAEDQRYQFLCHTYLQDLCQELTSLVGRVRILVSLPQPPILPSWIAFGQGPDPAPPVETTVVENGLQIERQLAGYLMELRLLLRNEDSALKELALTQLDSLEERCREAGLQLLLIGVYESKAEALKGLGREADIPLVWLEKAKSQNATRGSVSSDRWLLDQIGKTISSMDESARQEYYSLRCTVAAQSGDFRTLETLCAKLDPDPVSPFSFPRDQLAFEARFSEAKALFIHRTLTDAFPAGEALLERVDGKSSEAQVKTHLLLLQMARASEVKARVERTRLFFQRGLEQIKTEELSAAAAILFLHAQALDAHLDFMFAEEGVALGGAFSRWQELNQNIPDDKAWAYFMFDRLQVGFARNFYEFSLDPLRIAAVTILKREERVAAGAVKRASAFLAAENYMSALEEVHKALALALDENDWSSYTQARTILPLLWLADGRSAEAANAYWHYDVYIPEKTFLERVGTMVTEDDVDDMVRRALESELSERSQSRAWQLLLSMAHSISYRDRQKILDHAESSTVRIPTRRVEAQEREQLMRLLGAFFKCPADDEAPRLLDLLVSLSAYGPAEIKIEALRQIRTAFWSATGPSLPSPFLQKLVGELDDLFQRQGEDEDRLRIALDIVSSLARNNPSDTILQRLASTFIEARGSARDATEMLAFSGSEVSPDAVETALAAALKVLSRRIERKPGGIIQTGLFADNVNEVIPFVAGFSLEQITILYEAMLAAAVDSESDAHLRAQVFEFLKNRVFQKLPVRMLRKGAELLFERLEGRHAENAFDRGHREANSTIYSGLKVNPDQDLRIQRDALIALAAFQVNPQVGNLERYADLLSRLAFSENSTTRQSVAVSIKVYFQCRNQSDPLLIPVILKLIGDGSPSVSGAGIVAAAEELAATGKIGKLTFRLIDSVYQSRPGLERRKAIAVFCRLALTSNYRGRHYREIVRWHNALTADRSVTVRKYADTQFWMIRSEQDQGGFRLMENRNG